MAKKYISQFTGAEIDARLAEVAGKYGYLNMRFKEAESMYYIECFANEDDFKLYETDMEAYEHLRLQNVQIPISTVQGDAFTATLKTSIANDANIVVAENKLEVPLNFHAIKITQIGNENANYTGTLVVQRSTDGATWDTVGSLPNVLTPKELDDMDSYQMVDIGGFLVQGRQMVRVRASYAYTNEDGEEKTVTSGNALVGASVTRTTLSLALVDNYEEPKSPVNINGDVAPFAVNYRVMGAVAKTIHWEITGSTGKVLKVEQTSTASDDNITKGFSVNEDVAYGLLTHGVKKVKAWMEAEDGLGGVLTSNVLVNRFMMVADTTSTQPYLLLQNVDDEITNFVQTEVAQYAVYNPSGDALNVAFVMTGYTEDYETTKPTEYFRVEQVVQPKTQNKLLTTIEIEPEDESQVITHYDTYFRVRRVDGDVETDFMKESTNETSYYVKVDNTNSFAPVTGATFLLNPKVRNNNEANPARILNAKNKNAEVEADFKNFGFINDGWMTADDGQKVLRVMAGSTLTIHHNVWKQFLTNPKSSMTFELDFKVSNITNLTNPIVNMSEGTASSFKGLRMNAMDGWICSASYASKDDCLFSWQEDVRTHMVLNIHHQVMPNKGDVTYTESNASAAQGTMALARVLINGDVVREIPFKTDSASEWISGDTGTIVIGNAGADIDIYSMRIYANKPIEVVDLLNRNYLSSRPTSEEKVKIFTRNNILTGGKIDIEKVKALGINCMVWHGVLPYHGNQAEQTGWYEYFRYDDKGNYLPEYSGTNCKATKSLKGKGQGSTAKTYYDWNLQEDNSKVKLIFGSNSIQVSVQDFHESISVSGPEQGTATDDKGNVYEGLVVKIKGGNLGKNYPVNEEEVAYPYSNGKVTVPDGWIDGNGKYRGKGYMVTEGTALAQKKVIKINYASSMQSHLLGACKTYDLLHRLVVGDTPLQKAVPTAVSAKHTEPFMFFNETGDGNAQFKGMGNYGAGKMDKVAWGYAKKLHPMFTLIEGSDNNLPLTGFRVPFDQNTAVYSTKGEGWLYNGNQSFDFDAGATTDSYSDGYTHDGSVNDDGEVELPKAAIRNRWADIHNFIYLHSSNIKYYNGTFDAFKQSTSVTDYGNKYWCNQGTEAYKLKRYCYLTKTWIDAGLWDGSAYKVVDLSTDSVTASAYTDNVSSGDYAVLNEAFIRAYVAHMKAFAKYFFNARSLLFNYAYVLCFMAGTDNSDKNTYYKLMPYAENYSGDALTTDGQAFGAWFSEHYGKTFDFENVYQLYFDGDDMDSIFRTNNNSHQTKPYYIDRLHPYADTDESTSLYEGMGNQLFNFVEKAYEPTHEIASMLNEILCAATTLVSEDDVFYGLTSNKKSVWGFLHKYFFNTQMYFPQVAYLEQARIRYEFPQLIGFISSGGGARNITPISQSLGSQLQNELQYMNQRLVYLASYAGFGEFTGQTGYSIGLDDVKDTFSFTPAAMPDGSPSTYTFTVKTHQYFYPSYIVGQTFTQTHHRCKPGKEFTFTIAESITGSDTGLGIAGIHYYSDLGGFSGKSITGSLNITGKRLTRIFNQFSSNDNFCNPRSLTINCPNLETIQFYSYNDFASSLDLSKNVRLTSINLYIKTSEVLLPKTHNLEKLSYYGIVPNIKMEEMPNLSYLNLSISPCRNVQSLWVGKNVGTNIPTFQGQLQSVVNNIYTAQSAMTAPSLKTLHIEDINWTDFDVNALSWLADIPTCELEGEISIKEDNTYGLPNVTWDLKNKFIGKWGNVDSTASQFHQGLKLNYLKRVFQPDNATIKGNFYTEAGSTFPFELRPSSVYENTQARIRWWLSSEVGMKIDAVTGVVTVTDLSDTQTLVDVRALCNYYDDSGNALQANVEKTIEIWNRPAQLGDLVYADGTFSSVASYEEEKTPIGVCIWTAPRDADGNVVEEYANPNDKQLRLMVALEDVNVDLGTDETGLQWGAMLVQSAETDEYNAQYALFDTDTSGNKVELTSQVVKDANGKSSVYDIPTITNITSQGLDNAYINPDPTTNPNGESDFRSTEDDALMYNQGFKVVEASTMIGDGFGYGETSTMVKERTLDADLAKLAGSGYSQGDVVNSAYAKTLKVVQHRNLLLNNNIYGADDKVLIAGGVFPVPVATSSKTELVALGELMNSLRTWGKSSHGETETNAIKWSQLAFPLASACYAYEPIRKWKDGEVLADKFKAHNWFAPTQGLLARICWYAKYGESQGVTVLSDAISKNVLKISTSSNHWSVTETYSSSAWVVNSLNGGTVGYSKNRRLVGRPISAF